MRLTTKGRFAVTAMIDLVTLMNIYFLITLSVGAAAEIDLPRAKRSKPLDAEVATMITVLPGRDVSSVVVELKLEVEDPLGLTSA